MEIEPVIIVLVA